MAAFGSMTAISRPASTSGIAASPMTIWWIERNRDDNKADQQEQNGIEDIIDQ